MTTNETGPLGMTHLFVVITLTELYGNWRKFAKHSPSSDLHDPLYVIEWLSCGIDVRELPWWFVHPWYGGVVSHGLILVACHFFMVSALSKMKSGAFFGPNKQVKSEI